MYKILLPPMVVAFCMIFSCGNAQNEFNLQAIVLDSSLTKEANAIIRIQETTIDLESINSMIVKTRRVVTVLNEIGNRHAYVYERYSPSTKIHRLEALIFNASGIEIKKYKKKDFYDRSAYDGVSLAVDDRVKYIEYTPTEYPYTLVFESEVASESTLGIPGWVPLSSSRLSVEKSSYQINNTSGIKLRFKEKNFDTHAIKKSIEENVVRYETSNMSAIEREAYSPSFYELVPVLKVVPNQFILEGIEGNASDWESFGKWLFDELVSGRNQLPQETIDEITFLLKNANTKEEKAKLIYEYVQNKTRYISIQLGIGGWMPFSAEEVDRLGYGDCKALTNYTKALLDSQGVTSYYTVVYGDKSIRDIDQNFASLQGNHVILNIPNEGDDIWLECTNQTTPFNFIAGFTDNRNVLIVKPDGGEIKHTKKYTALDNSLYSVASLDIQPDGAIKASVNMESKGIQYGQRYGIQSKSEKEQKVHYKDYWNYINGLTISSLSYKNDKEKVVFSEKVDIHSSNYCTKAGSRLLINPNVFNRYTYKLPNYENRKMPLVIARGYQDTDEYVINLPSGFTIRTIPKEKTIHSEFGSYSWHLEKISETQLKFKRVLQVKDGKYSKEKYREYRQFMLDVRNADASKIVLGKL